ncbi:MAG: lipoyl(octanoyl) transferase [Gaiellaceae bacterium]|nr:lipoyl(octanoyl) transferase [Gaiellaceae bacterium]
METRRVERAAEVAIFLARRRRQEILVVHRCPTLGSFWHAISGAIETGEGVDEAAIRELREETGLDATETLPLCMRTEFSYRLNQSPRRAGKRVRVCCFLLDVPDDFEPKLNWEHDEHRWLATNLAPAYLKWPSLRGALCAVLRLSDGDGARPSSRAEKLVSCRGAVRRRVVAP